MANMRHDFLSLFSLSVSVFGLFTVLMLAFNPPTANEGFYWRKPLVGFIFSLICILGVFAVLSPTRCSHGLHFRSQNALVSSHRTRFGSHHPDCEEFSAHVMHVRGHAVCAACAGLLVGALIALIGATFHFFSGWCVETPSLPTVLIGVTATALGFLQLKFGGLTRSLLNVIFVQGAFLILVGIDELAESLLVDLFLLAYIVFWILTRIGLSQWDHWRICSSCSSPCEEGAVGKRIRG